MKANMTNEDRVKEYRFLSIMSALIGIIAIYGMITGNLIHPLAYLVIIPITLASIAISIYCLKKYKEFKLKIKENINEG